MKECFKNGYRFWLSPKGNAIWSKNDGTVWFIGQKKRLGTKISSLFLPIMNTSRDCPHNNLQSNWWYFDITKKVFQEDVFNAVKIDCLKGMLLIILLSLFYGIGQLLSLQGFGMIRFTSNEYLVSNDSLKVKVLVERIHTNKDTVDVKWKTSPNLGLNGLLQFANNETEKIITLDLQTVADNQSIQIELLQPTNDYQLGENKVAKISRVCKLSLTII